MLRPLGFLLMSTLTAAADTDYALTIYSSAQSNVQPEQLTDAATIPGYALVSDTRKMRLPDGRGEVRFTDVAQLIDPTTVAFASLTDPRGTRVLEQNYQFDLVSQAKLLERYIGQEIAVQQRLGDKLVDLQGTLLGSRDGLLIQTASGQVLSLNDYANVRFTALPGGLITRPTLVWLVEAKQGGEHQARVAYQTRGMTWWTDYNIVLGAEDKKPTMDLTAWVTVVNQSGGSYPQAKIKLVAGEVNRAPTPAPMQTRMMAKSDVATQSVEEGFTEAGLFEYHLYTLGRRSDLPDNSTKQLELFPGVRAVPVRRQLVFSVPNLQNTYFYGEANADQNLGSFAKGEVGAYLEFANKADGGLGMPLPKGRVRVSQAGPDGSLEFIGEDIIEHTPRNENLRLKLGKSFDVVGDRKQTDFQVDAAGKTITESFEISIRNAKQVPVSLVAREYLYRWSAWEITKANATYSKRDANTIDFPVEIAAGGETKLSYTVRYKW